MQRSWWRRWLWCAMAVGGAASALDIEWVRTTGQWPVDTPPLVADIDGDGRTELIALNRGGQVLVWAIDGSDISQDQEGIRGRFPEGQWTSSPVLIESPDGPVLVACNGDGVVTALGPDFKVRWNVQLPGKTTWGRATPAVILSAASSPLLCYMDTSGTLTAVTASGGVAWSVPGTSPGGPAPTSVAGPDGRAYILAPLGTGLARVTPDGTVDWRVEIAQSDAPHLAAPPAGVPAPHVRSRVHVLDVQGRQVGLCLAGGGLVAAFDLENGDTLWRTQLPSDVDSALAVLERPGEEPLILCAGLFGNLYALSVDGRREWTHEYRAKARGGLLIADADGDGDAEILFPTYAQHVLVFDEKGYLVDDFRVNGSANPSTVLPVDSARGRRDVLVTTSSLLAYRLRPSVAHTPYKPVPDTGDVRLSRGGSRMENPAGRFVSVHVTAQRESGVALSGVMTTRSYAELAAPRDGADGLTSARAIVRDAHGQVLVESEWSPPSETPPVDALRLEDAYGSGSALTHDTPHLSLYVGEVGQVALRVPSGLGPNALAPENGPARVRVHLDTPVDAEGNAFGGAFYIYAMVEVGTLNGATPHSDVPRLNANRERVLDALVPLSSSGVLDVPRPEGARLWVSVDAHGARPGRYAGKLVLTFLPGGDTAGEVPLDIEVLPLAMPERFPLTLCTWDYVPNKWYPDHTAEVLDDMRRHGVDVFPRGAVPAATVDAEGNLHMDWTPLDVELARLEGRGVILFQIGHPPIGFASPVDETAKRKAELAYLRAFRVYLKGKGWDYDDYAFYPTDEPGLNYQNETTHALIDAAKLFREADPRLRVYTDPVPTLSWSLFKEIQPLIDVWCPNMRQVTGLLAGDPRIAAIMASGNPVWSYECVAQVKSLSPLRYNRANAWRAGYFGLDGIGFWTHSQTQKDMWYPSDDEYALVYPGDLPVPSVRWEAVRDGLEDHAAIVMLQDAIARHRSAGTRLDEAARADEALRIAYNDIMELSDAAFVESRDYLAQGDRCIWHTDADAETYRHHRAAIARWTLALGTP